MQRDKFEDLRTLLVTWRGRVVFEGLSTIALIGNTLHSAHPAPSGDETMRNPELAPIIQQLQCLSLRQHHHLLNLEKPSSTVCVPFFRSGEGKTAELLRAMGPYGAYKELRCWRSSRYALVTGRNLTHPNQSVAPISRPATTETLNNSLKQATK
jgi:hypothetical protein